MTAWIPGEADGEAGHRAADVGGEGLGDLGPLRHVLGVLGVAETVAGGFWGW